LISLGEFLKKARTDLGLSLREVEEKSGVSNAYISMIESGKRLDPHPNILRKLAKAYHLDIKLLMEMAGYLTLEIEEKSEKDETEEWFQRATADPAFSFGRRSSKKIDSKTKKMIALMYKQLKEKEKKE